MGMGMKGEQPKKMNEWMGMELRMDNKMNSELMMIEIINEW